MNGYYVLGLHGAPGCGKGYLGEATRATLIEQGIVPNEEILYISTGELIRKEIELKTEVGLQIKRIVERGKLVPDQIVDQLVANALLADAKVKILDGYPRNLHQLEFLKKQLEGKKLQYLTVFRDTDVELILRRVKNRRICKNCGRTHSVEDGKCPACGGESIVRKDDAVIEDRLREYQENTAPLWPLMYQLGATLRIDGSIEAKEAAKQIVQLFF